jgi:hypothetical protein
VAIIKNSLPLIHTGEDRIGWMKDETWKGMYKILISQGFLAEPMDVKKVYTMQFLRKIYEGGGK